MLRNATLRYLTRRVVTPNQLLLVKPNNLLPNVINLCYIVLVAVIYVVLEAAGTQRYLGMRTCWHTPASVLRPLIQIKKKIKLHFLILVVATPNYTILLCSTLPCSVGGKER